MLLGASRWMPFLSGLPSQSEQTTLNTLDWNFVMPRMACEVENGACRVGLYTGCLFLPNKLRNIYSEFPTIAMIRCLIPFYCVLMAGRCLFQIINSRCVPDSSVILCPLCV